MNENKTETRETNGELESTSEPGSPVKCVENEGDNRVISLDLSPLGKKKEEEEENNNHEENEYKSFSRGIKTLLSFRRGTPTSDKEKLTEEFDIFRTSRRLSQRIFNWSQDNTRAGEGNSGIPKKTQVSGGEAVRKEPLSVMEINELIQKRELLEAFENIKNLEMELLAERDAKKYEDNPKEYIVRAKDVDLLYKSVSETIQHIVEETLDLPGIDAKALTSLVSLIEEEEKTHAEAAKIAIPSEPVDRLGSARNWRELWKENVKGSVKERVHKVALPLKEDNPSWLSVYLGYLRSIIRQDLLKIKLYVQKCYPQEYNLCDTYMKAFHGALSLHLQNILEDSSLEFNELHAILSWVTKVYRSEDFLGHPDLQPEMKPEDLPGLLTSEALDKLKHDYIHSVKEKTKTYLDTILKLEHEKKWESEEQPKASLSFDIQTIIGEHMKASGSICKSLETAILEVSLKEVKEFIPRFGKTFLDCKKVKDHPQFVPFMVTYMNNFHDLKMGLQTNFNAGCQELENTLMDLMLRYKKEILNKLRLETQPLFNKILSRTWISSGETLDLFVMKILYIVEDFCKCLMDLKEPICKDFLNEVHKYVVKEYITQTLKPRGWMNRAKREIVSKIMNQEAAAIHNTMKQLGSSSDWLCPAIQYIASIIGEKKKHNIQDHIRDLTRDYPDIRKEHIVAILALRVWWQNRRNSIADHTDGPSEDLELRPNRRLFDEVELPNTIWCF